MSARLTVGLSRKLGQPNYGSLGASCYIDLEVDNEVLLNQRELLSARIKETFRVCRDEIERELAGDSLHSSEAPARLGSTINGSSTPRSHTATRSGHHQAPIRPATENQIRAIHAIAVKANVQLANQLAADFGVASPAQLNICQASELIELLKSQLPVS